MILFICDLSQINVRGRVMLTGAPGTLVKETKKRNFISNKTLQQVESSLFNMVFLSELIDRSFLCLVGVFLMGLGSLQQRNE
jgi:hypothetical protein